MICEAKDIPRENLFLVGIVKKRTTRDFFHIGNPRDPFILSRAEALNIIGYMITHADWTVRDVESEINSFFPEKGPFRVTSDEIRGIIECFPHPALPKQERTRLAYYLLTMEEAKILAAALIHAFKFKPKELDAAVVAIFEHARNADGTGQSEDDMLVKLLS
jgi:hypothetical protein